MYVPSTGRFLSRDPLVGAEQELLFTDELVAEIVRQRSKQAYAYAGNNPVNFADPSGLLFGWGYGNFCGWSRRANCPPGSGPLYPIDALDAACERHDCCQATWWTCNPYHLEKCSLKLCEGAVDAIKFGCKQSYPPDKAKNRLACIDAAYDVARLFCILAGAPSLIPILSNK